jgi:hypothetical protein
MNNSIHQIVEKWEKTHLLDELTTDKKVRCAISLEEMGDILLQEKAKRLNEVKGKSSEDIVSTIIPIVRRLYGKNLELMPTMQSLYEDYIHFLNGDMEAFLCEAYVENLVRRLNK